jgi:multidrug efflux system membrane fusion protein
VSPIYASFDADEQLITRALKDLPGGASARAHIERIPVELGTAGSTDTPYRGKLQLVDNQVDAKSGTVRVRARFDNADGTLMPGQFARLRMGRATAESALLINERAVGTDQNKRFVMVVDAENKAAYREVTLGPSINGLRIVSSGLKPGERIVVNGVQRVRPGALLAPQEVAMDAKPELQAARSAAQPS